MQEKEGDEINPTGVKGFEDGAFKDHCRYVYSLSSLHTVLKSFASFDEVISKRREQKEEKTEDQWRGDLKRLVNLPCSVAFDLRGYIGAFSEQNMIFEADKLQDLRDVLKRWSSSTMNNGKTQDKLYQFLWDYAATQICDEDNSLVGEEHQCLRMKKMDM